MASESKFTNARITGTLAVVGVLTAGVVSLTTITATTGNYTTVNTQTLSGATIRALNPNGVVRARTVSGASLNLGGAGITAGQALCMKTTGVVGYCSTTPTSGTCTCN